MTAVTSIFLVLTARMVRNYGRATARLPEPKMVADIVSGASGSSPVNLTSFNGKLYFGTATEPTSGLELWVSNGIPTGQPGADTHMVTDLNPGTGSGLTYPGFHATNFGRHRGEPYFFRYERP